jgi:hypothetical protein
MGLKKLRHTWTGVGFWLLVAVCSGLLAFPRQTQTAEKPEPGSYIVLSGEFFSAMQKLAASGATYGDRQEPLLEQIALSGQYMVKTNLTLIHQNEKIIQLLEELNRKRLTMER